jgi:hypothetical protein
MQKITDIPNYTTSIRVLAKPIVEGSKRLQCSELHPTVTSVIVDEVESTIVDPAFTPQTELTQGQIDAGWTMLFSLETLNQYFADNAADINVEAAAIEASVE